MEIEQTEENLHEEMILENEEANLENKETIGESNIVIQKHEENNLPEAKENLPSEVGEATAENLYARYQKQIKIPQKSEETSPEIEGHSATKRGKAAVKNSLKGKHTVPHPFTLETEKRTRERKASCPSLTRSVSLSAHGQSPSMKSHSQNILRLEKSTDQRQEIVTAKLNHQKMTRSQSAKIMRNSEVKHGESGSTVKNKECAVKHTEAGNHMKCKVHARAAGERKPRTCLKSKEENDLDMDILSFQFRALPLPSFYHGKTLENARTAEYASIGLGSKSMSRSEYGRMEATSRVCPRTITSDTKEAIKKLLQGSWKASGGCERNNMAVAG